MTYNVRTAKRLLTGPEIALYEQSRRSGLQGLTEKQVHQDITRARKLHDRLALQAGRVTDADASTKAALSLEILHRFERRYAHVLMDPKHHNQKHQTPPHVGDNMEASRLGPPTQETKARAQYEVAQGASRRIDGMVASQERRVQNRNDKR